MYQTASMSESAWCLQATQKQKRARPPMPFVVMAAVCTLPKMRKQKLSYDRDTAWQCCGKVSQKAETQLVTKASSYLPTSSPIFTSYILTGGNEANERIRSRGYPSAPQPQVTLLSSAIWNQDSHAPLSHLLSVFTHRSTATPLGQGGKRR